MRSDKNMSDVPITPDCLIRLLGMRSAYDLAAAVRIAPDSKLDCSSSNVAASTASGNSSVSTLINEIRYDRTAPGQM
jgi:hypothetical protein